jgi:hypothetical protein
LLRKGRQSEAMQGNGRGETRLGYDRQGTERDDNDRDETRLR